MRFHTKVKYGGNNRTNRILQHHKRGFKMNSKIAGISFEGRQELIKDRKKEKDIEDGIKK